MATPVDPEELARLERRSVIYPLNRPYGADAAMPIDEWTTRGWTPHHTEFVADEQEDPLETTEYAVPGWADPDPVSTATGDEYTEAVLTDRVETLGWNHQYGKDIPPGDTEWDILGWTSQNQAAYSGGDTTPDNDRSFAVPGWADPNDVAGGGTVQLPSPANLVASATGQTTGEATWDEVPYALSYKVALVVAQGAAPGTVTVEGTTATFTDLTPGSTYEVGVVAVGNHYDRLDSEPAVATLVTDTQWPAGLVNYMELGTFTRAQLIGTNVVAKATGEQVWTELTGGALEPTDTAGAGTVLGAITGDDVTATVANSLKAQAVPAGTPCTYSMYVSPQAVDLPVKADIVWDAGQAAQGTETTVAAHAWERISVVGQSAPAGATEAYGTWQVGSDASPAGRTPALLTRAMATQGTKLYDYGDPTCAPGWFWQTAEDGISEYLAPAYDNFCIDDSSLYFVSGEELPEIDTYDPDHWYEFTASSELGTTQGSVLRCHGYNVVGGLLNIPYEPGYVYQIAVSMRQVASPAAGSHHYVGLAGVAADGVTLVNRSGADSWGGQYYPGLNRSALPDAQTQWTSYSYVVGYASGTSTSVSTATSDDQFAPIPLRTEVAYVRPFIYANHREPEGVVDIDRITITRRPLAAQLAQPTNLTAEAVAPQRVRATWDAVEGATGYGVFVTPADGGSVRRTYVAGTNAVVTGLTPGGNDQLDVVAQGDGVNSADSPPAVTTVTTPLPQLDTPANLSASNITPNAADISWDAVDGATSYEVTYTPEEN
jgi:hypothetical protein